MSPKSFLLSEELAQYVVTHSMPMTAVERALVERTAALGAVSTMQIAPEQAGFLSWLAAAVGARTAVEIGTFTGRSALAIAQGMGVGSEMVCFDVSAEWISIARSAWEDAGVSERITVFLGDAHELLPAMAPDSIDFAFIDADKPGYLHYYETILARLSPRGVILVDNTLWSGRVLDTASDDPDTVALREFNDAITSDTRVHSVLLPIADGLTLIRHAEIASSV